MPFAVGTVMQVETDIGATPPHVAVAGTAVPVYSRTSTVVLVVALITRKPICVVSVGTHDSSMIFSASVGDGPRERPQRIAVYRWPLSTFIVESPMQVVAAAAQPTR